MSWKEKLWQEIRKARSEMGLTQEELQRALQSAGLSMSLTTLKAYESGKWAPDFGDLRTIAHVLKTDYFELDDNIRVDFSPNGKLRLEVLPQQLKLDMDPNGKISIHRQENHTATIRRIRA